MLHGGARGRQPDRLGVAEPVGVQIQERIDVLLDVAAAGGRRALRSIACATLLALHRHALARFRRRLRRRAMRARQRQVERALAGRLRRVAPAAPRCAGPGAASSAASADSRAPVSYPSCAIEPAMMHSDVESIRPCPGSRCAISSLSQIELRRLRERRAAVERQEFPRMRRRT